MSSDNAIAGAVKKSFINFNVPGSFEERVAEVKQKVDVLIEHQKNDQATFPISGEKNKRNLDIFDKRTAVLQ